IAHEIINPLAYVMANLSFVHDALADVVAASRALLQASAPAPDERFSKLPPRLDEVQAALDEALEGAERIRRIVRDVRSVSTVDDSRREVVDVPSVLESSLNIVGNEIRHRARLVRDFASVPRVVANPARLGQVFINILINAAQSIPEGNTSNNEI